MFFTPRLPRQGPWNDGSTRRAFHMLTDLPPIPAILDVGCGSGAQTLALTRFCEKVVVSAMDYHSPFLEELERRESAGRVNGWD